MKVILKILIICLAFLCLQMHAQGAPTTKGRYVRLRCKPDTKNSNCVEEWGPLMDLPVPRGAKAPHKIEKYDFTPNFQEELSGDGSSGDKFLDIQDPLGQKLGLQQELGAFAPEDGSAEVDEGSAAGIDFTFSKKVLERSAPVEMELKEDNLIL